MAEDGMDAGFRLAFPIGSNGGLSLFALSCLVLQTGLLQTGLNIIRVIFTQYFIRVYLLAQEEPMKTYLEPSQAAALALIRRGIAGEVMMLNLLRLATWPIVRYVPRPRLLSRSAAPRPTAGISPTRNHRDRHSRNAYSRYYSDSPPKFRYPAIGAAIIPAMTLRFCGK
jgi:hypothetical protein